MDEIERSVNEVNRMLGDPDDVNISGVPSGKKGGTRSKVIHNHTNISTAYCIFDISMFMFCKSCS